MKPKQKSSAQGNSELNAELNPSWTTGDFARYGESYFSAGDLLARTIINAVTGKWMEWKMDEENLEWLVGDVSADALVFPLLGLYRQGTELMLKHFIYDKPNSLPKIASSHNLDDLWVQAKPELFGLGLEENSSEITGIQEFVKKLHELDPSGEAFRFPTNLYRQAFFENSQLSNIESLYQEARKVREIFYGLAEGRKELWSESMEDWDSDE